MEINCQWYSIFNQNVARAQQLVPNSSVKESVCAKEGREILKGYVLVKPALNAMLTK